jgi:hypothetical protein
MPKGTDAAGIKALDRAGLEALAADTGQPRFRATQLALALPALPVPSPK